VIEELIFIGDNFYMESGTAMSSIYKVNGERFDYGFLQRDLAAGKSFFIRPATKEELSHFKQVLQEIILINTLRE